MNFSIPIAAVVSICMVLGLQHNFVHAKVVADTEIQGYWRKADEPVWIEIKQQAGNSVGLVVRNDDRPGSVGKVMLKEIIPQQEKQWQAQVYAQQLGRFTRAKITMPAADRMKFTVKVGFITRRVGWHKVSQVPAFEQGTD